MSDTSPTTAEQLLEEARATLERLSPLQACEVVRAGALMIDIRCEERRVRDGVIPGSRCIPRNVFEWRSDPSSPWHDPKVVCNPARRLIVICDEGYQSSLAAATLRRFGFLTATDVIGGFQAWREAGLEIEHPHGTRGS
jgi:rhodanese-related sulfurtransferase